VLEWWEYFGSFGNDVFGDDTDDCLTHPSDPFEELATHSTG
jgi:hypothetical protein